MKKIIIIVILLVSVQSYGQLKKTKKKVDNLVIHISNQKNFNHSIFKDLDKTIKKYVFTAQLIDMGKYNLSSTLEKKYSNSNSEYVTTAIRFFVNNNESKEYSYPINRKKFNSEYFKDKLYPVISSNKTKVKIYVSIFQTNKTPVVVIDYVKLQ